MNQQMNLTADNTLNRAAITHVTVPRHILEHKQLTGLSKLVYAVLSTPNKQPVKISYESLAVVCGCTRRSVEHAVRLLAEQGLIVVHKSNVGHNVYSIV